MQTNILIFSCGMLVAIAFALPAADDSDLETITMEGTGKNANSAETWACRKAIERIVWQFADSETREQHKNALQQKLYENPEAFVSSTEIVSTKTMGNMVTVLAKVTVKKDKVQAKLQELSIVSVAKARKENMPSKTTTPMENTNSSETGSNNAMEESVIVEGLGKTEASAKKAAYKEAVAKVVGVLIDSSTLVKNDKIIDEELLEYSGGFVKKAEILSSKTDDEGLVRVRVKCLIEKAQVKRKLEDMKVLVVKVDGASLAAREMTQEDMRKNAATLVNKALEERKKIYEVKMPKKLEELEKQENGCVYLPVSVEFNEAKFKAWVDNWVPVFDKLALEKTSGISNYKKQERSDYFTSGYGDAATEDRFFKPLIKDSESISSSQMFYLVVATNSLKTGPVQYHAYKIPCGIQQIDGLGYINTTAAIRSKSNDLMYSGVCERYGVIQENKGYIKNPQAQRNHDRCSVFDTKIVRPWDAGIGENGIDYNSAYPKRAIIIIPPFPGHLGLNPYSQENKFYYVGNFGCFFKVYLSELNLNDIEKIEASIEWKKSDKSLKR